MNVNLKPKRSFALVLIFCILLSSIINVGIVTPSENQQLLRKDTVNLSTLTIDKEKEFLQVQLEGSTSFLNDPGKPMLPIITKSYNFPIGTKIHQIYCTPSNKDTFTLEEQIQKVPYQIPRISNTQLISTYLEKIQEEVTNNARSVYPEELYDYFIGVGLDKGERVLIVTIHSYPIQYDLTQNQLNYFQTLNISISYELPTDDPITSNEYDMVIIAPRKFIIPLQPLVLHKNLLGIKTMIKTTESIYRDSFLGKYDENGRDQPEKIKYFIKYAIENYGIRYVLLVGGHEQQRSSWHVPVRYSNLHDRSFWNDTYVTDLYYADIYRYNGSSGSYEFDDWDSNHNDIIGEWTWIYDPERGWWYDLDKKDELDLYPDVYIGRLACRDLTEVRYVVNKIISYERGIRSNDWFKNIICVGGDTVPYTDGICEGEIETGLGASYLESLGFEAQKVWVTNNALTGPSAVIKELIPGAGFIYLSGHGTPMEWCTHPAADGDTWIDLYGFQMQHLFNRNRLPICIVGGCHNSQFDVTLMNMVKGLIEYGSRYFFWDEGIDCFPKWSWIPECWSWNLVSQKHDGFIAAIGNTGLGWGVGGENCVQYNEGYLTSHFFQVYASLSLEGYDSLGMVHSETINDYIDRFLPNTDLLDRKTIEEWVLLGDPSLQIGG